MRKVSRSSRVISARIALLAFVAGGLVTSSTGRAGELVLRKGDRVAIVGDSITEQKQYSRFMETYLLACVPELDLTMYQFGWSGERAPGFANRMENDFVPWNATVVNLQNQDYRFSGDEVANNIVLLDGQTIIVGACMTCTPP